MTPQELEKEYLEDLEQVDVTTNEGQTLLLSYAKLQETRIKDEEWNTKNWEIIQKSDREDRKIELEHEERMKQSEVQDKESKRKLVGTVLGGLALFATAIFTSGLEETRPITGKSFEFTKKFLSKL